MAYIVEAIAICLFLRLKHKTAEIIGSKLSFLTLIKYLLLERKTAQNIHEYLTHILQVKLQKPGFVHTGTPAHGILLDDGFRKGACGLCKRHGAAAQGIIHILNAEVMVCVSELMGKRDDVRERSGEVGEYAGFLLYGKILTICATYFARAYTGINPAAAECTGSKITHLLTERCVFLYDIVSCFVKLPDFICQRIFRGFTCRLNVRQRREQIIKSNSCRRSFLSGGAVLLEHCGLCFKILPPERQAVSYCLQQSLKRPAAHA